MAEPVLAQIEVDGTLYNIATLYTNEYISNAYINSLGQLILEVDSDLENAENISV